MNTDLVDSMNIDQSLIFEHDDNEIILEVNEEDAQRLLSETDTSATTTSNGTTPPSANIANDLTTINAKDFGSANFSHLITIKAAYAVRNVAFQNETDSIQVATTTCQARTNFHTRESWWAEQLKQAKKMIQQTTPYSWANAAHVLELTNPHLYYFITGAHNCQVLKKIELPLTPEKLSFTNTGQRTRRKFQNSDQLHSQLRQTRTPTQGRCMETNGTTYPTHLPSSKDNGRILYGITRSQLHQIGRQNVYSSSKKTI